VSEQRPSIGRIVHQQHPQHGCMAAVIVANHPVRGTVDLDRFQHPHAGGGLLYDVAPGDPGSPGTWHWPERA
jgi:hypothetical protein